VNIYKFSFHSNIKIANSINSETIKSEFYNPIKNIMNKSLSLSYNNNKDLNNIPNNNNIFILMKIIIILINLIIVF